MGRDAVILEVGLNEAASRAQNPRVPYAPRECAEDARRCREAGAAVVHWHARDPATGEQRLGDVALHAAAFEPMRAAGLLAYPSYPIEPDSLDGRLGHCFALRARYGLELVPIDAGSVNVVVWDERARAFVAIDAPGAPGVVSNPLRFTLAALERAYASGMVPTLGSFDVGITRTIGLLAESGRLRAPVYLKIFLSGAWAAGPLPSEEALALHLQQLPAGLDVEWVLVPYAIADPALIERLCRRALELGGGIRVGIGDAPAANPNACNADLVEQAVGWARAAGREVASPDDVRRRLGLPTAAEKND